MVLERKLSHAYIGNINRGRVFRWREVTTVLYPILVRVGQCFYMYFVVVQLLRCVWFCDSSTPGFPVLRCLRELAQIYVHWVDDAIQLSDSLSLPFLILPSVFLSIRVFSKELALPIGWPKYCSFSFSWIFRVNFLVFQLIDWCYEVYYLESDRARTWDPAAKTLEPPHL